MAVIKEDDKFKLHSLIFDDDLGFHKNNLWFAPISIGKRLSVTYKSLMNIQTVCFDVGMIIPYGKTFDMKQNNNWNRYFVFTKNWFIRTQNGSLKLPQLSRDLFCNIC